MKAAWFSNLKAEDQEQFKQLVKGSQKVLDRLKEICYNKLSTQEVLPASDYDNPSWAYKQADRNGYLRAFREIGDLVTLSDQD